MLNIKDKVVVYGHMPPAIVKDIVVDAERNRTKAILDWGHLGTSYVYLHDEGKVWFKYSDVN